MTDKPRMVEVEGDELAALRDSTSLSDPILVPNSGKWYADAEELRAWRQYRDAVR